jgi:ABC-2 type transport system ATP-binding protein
VRTVRCAVHKPKVLFLDEPTIGLDVSMQSRMRQFIKRYNEEFGATVILTSHYMEDVAALCPRVVIIDKGTLIYDGELKALVKRIRPERRLTIGLVSPVSAEAISPLGGVITHEDGRCVISVPTERVNDAVKHALAHLPVADLTIEDPPLEDVMREMFQQTAAEAS